MGYERSGWVDAYIWKTGFDLKSRNAHKSFALLICFSVCCFSRVSLIVRTGELLVTIG